MNSGVVQIRRQRGVILLALFAVLFIAGAGVLISVLDSGAIAQRRNYNTMVALREAKASLIAYAALYSDYYSGASSGPGYLPCPDTNGNGAENAPCGANNLGRLPQAIAQPTVGKTFPLSTYNSDIDQQFWYSVADNFRRDPLGVLNSSTLSATTLDGRDRIAPATPVPVPAWFTANGWLAVSNYTYVSDDQASLTFTGCANISYTVGYSPTDIPSDLARIGLRC